MPPIVVPSNNDHSNFPTDNLAYTDSTNICKFVTNICICNPKYL